MHATRRRRGQRGQALVIVALGAVVLLGATSLAVDLSLQTHNERTLQNVSDAAALSGAEDLPATPLAFDQYNGAQDALQMIRKKMGWQNLIVGNGSVNNTAWAAALAAACSPSSNTVSPPSCNITKTVCSSAVPPPSDLPPICDSKTSLAPNAHYYSITIQTPPKLSKVVNSTNPPYDPQHYFEVIITQDSQNYVAGVIGQGISTEASRSVAYHWAPNQTYGFALYASAIVGTQNKSTLVVGDVFAARNVDPQSSGQAGFCVANGHIVLGAPQYGVPDMTQPADGQSQVLPQSARVIQFNATGCTATTNTTVAGTVTETLDPQASCTVNGAAFTAKYDSQVGTCVANPSLPAPAFPIPTQSNPNDNRGCATPTSSSPASPGNYQYASGTGSCAGTGGEALVISSPQNGNQQPLNPGVYFVKHNPSCAPKSCYDVDISASVNLTGVTFWLDGDATLGVHGNSVTASIDPAPAVVNQSPADGRLSIYAPAGSPQVYVSDNGNSLTLYGTMYLPTGVAHTSSNAFYNIQGQAVVGTWDDQGGNHPSADISYDPTRSVVLPEQLKLVE